MLSTSCNVQFTDGKLSRMADDSLSAEAQLSATKDVSDMLADRLIIADYGKRRQPYVFCGFIPGSSVLSKWPHKSNKCVQSFGRVPICMF